MEWGLLHNVEKKNIYVKMYCVVILDVIGIALGIVLMNLGRAIFSGWCIYRGGAAEVSVDKN